MSSATDTYLLLRAFVDELARCGLRDACTSPGSRCTPILLSLAREPRLRCHSHIDERCSGFFALGLAKSSRLPVAITCTSGTAAAELMPAVIEAHEAGVPLLILTADRPPELRESGAGQTIDQIKLYGDAAKWFFEVGAHELGGRKGSAHGEEHQETGTSEAAAARLRWMRTLACRAYWRTLEGRPGVVHLNFPLREPLIADSESLPPDETGRPDDAPYVRRPMALLHAPDAMTELSTLLAACTRGVVIVGRHERATVAPAAAELCAVARWPLLADPLSGARRGDAAVAHYDALLRDSAFAAGVHPDVVIRIGALPTSKPLREWLAGLRDVPQALLDSEGDWQDPDAVLAYSLAVDPVRALEELTKSSLAPANHDWLEGWRSADERAAEAILGVLGATGLSEPAVAAELGVLLPEQATLFVASSMPVRDIESFWPVRPDPPQVLCNRGANGIDGTVSSAFGAAAEGRGPVVLLIGDVALAHDIGGLLAARRLNLDLTIVLIDNGGGGIFDFLPVANDPMARTVSGVTTRPGGADWNRPAEGEQTRNEPAESFAAEDPKSFTAEDPKSFTAEDPKSFAAEDPESFAAEDPESFAAEDLYTRHIATPTGLDFALAAQLYGLEHETVADVLAFRAALERALTRRPRCAGIIEVRTDRADNVALHRRAWEAVAGVLGGGI